MKTGSHDQSHINKYAKKDISQMYKDFNISDDGYNDQQVRFNRDIYGMNIGDKKIETTLYRFFRSFNNLFSMILLVLIVVSFFTDVIDVYKRQHRGNSISIYRTIEYSDNDLWLILEDTFADKVF